MHDLNVSRFGYIKVSAKCIHVNVINVLFKYKYIYNINVLLDNTLMLTNDILL